VYARPWWVDTVNFAPAGPLFGRVPPLTTCDPADLDQTSSPNTHKRARRHAGEALAQATTEFHSSCKALWQAVGQHLLS
jgi:hypothetical protein